MTGCAGSTGSEADPYQFEGIPFFIGRVGVGPCGDDRESVCCLGIITNTMETAITLTYEVELQFLDAGGEVTGEGTVTIADVATGRSALWEARSDSEARFVRCTVSAVSAGD
jgi:hypothetical protein